MRTRTRLTRLLSVAAAIPLALLFAPDADAGVSSGATVCLAEDPYHYSSVTAATIPMVKTVYGDPGLTLTIAITAGLTVTATASGSLSGEVSVIVAHANTTIGLSLAVSMSASVTYGGTWTVPASAHSGSLGAGAKADRMVWSRGHYAGCTWVIDRSGTLQAPYQLPYFWHAVS